MNKITVKIVSRSEFISLPPGTVYSKYKSFGNFDEICIKKSNAGDDDWRYQPLVEIDANSSGDLFDKINRAEESSSYELNLDFDCAKRDGLFDEKDRFVIFSTKDVEAMIAALKQATTANLEQA